MIIRPYKQSDFYAVVSLVHTTIAVMRKREPRCWSKEYHNLWDIRAHEEVLRDRMARRIVFVATVNQRVVGMVGFGQQKGAHPSEKRWHLNSLFVLPAYHRCGIGRALWAKADMVLRAKRARVVRVFSSISAVPFYTYCGFKKTTGKRKHYAVWTQPMNKRYI
jgi:predicted N-acetyltransferase YhbS